MANRPTGGNDDEKPVRQAVVVVHGMGSQEPGQTLFGFVKTALSPVPGDRPWRYYSRPAEITQSYEARRCIAPQLNGTPPPQEHTEIFEYHWSYLMTGNRFGDLVPTTARLLLRRRAGVPDGLYGAWRLLWWILAGVVLLVLILLALVLLLVPDNVTKVIGAVLTSGVVVGAATLGVGWVGNKVASSFVDVTRYLDKSPRSYSARRAIRGGLVDLLQRIHDEGYDRIVVVAHSLGGYIAYDALTSLWAQMHGLNAGAVPDPPRPGDPALAGLEDLEQHCDVLLAPLRARESAGDASTTASLPFAADADDTGTRPDVVEYQRLQFELWKGLRRQGNPWRVTDFLTVGTPMTFADLLMTTAKWRDGFGKPDGRKASCSMFGDMTRRGDLVRCPPRGETRTVEDVREPAHVHYGRSRAPGLQVLGSQSVFGPVRWTNVWFPVVRGSVRGDWFGGPLRPLFGPGIRDIRIDGNLDRRLTPALAHTYYFTFENDNSEGSIARTVRDTLALRDSYDSLVELRQSALPTDPSTGGPVIES
ncbi:MULTISPECIES: hypothetical protein [unclassified Mycobacterium]|uniref:hypothetical protein n=1 Tax=unclassified Mycobacterium TaxID=2642494 RepID=UPI0029C6CD5D|nr:MULTISPECIES: hypothetical protein [unclassified Mycobacterium]